MKLIRFGKTNEERPGIYLDGKRYDVSSFFDDYNEKFFQNGGLQKLKTVVEQDLDSLPLVDENERLGPSVARPSKLICIGLNYADHALETGSPIPTEPIIFFKATTAICGPNDDLVIPKNSEKTDWEVELAVVIGKKAQYVTLENALDHVAGYVLHNDYSERAFQLERGGQWVKGKSCDTFGPIGPFLATPDELSDINDLKLWLKVNGETVQQSSTKQLIFNIPHLIHYLSQFMTLLPGDIISTGTPHGVGMGFTPPRFLKPGDEVELGIEGLGSSKQKVTAHP